MTLYFRPRSQIVEAFRTLRTSLHYVADKEDMKVILITSPGMSDGKTTVVTNLAASLAQAGEKVLVIDADLRKPRCHKIFSISNRSGLTNALADSQDVEELIQTTTIDGLSVLTSGPTPPNPAELLESERMRTLLAKVRSNYDRVLVDCPPAGALADTYILASRVDGIILVLVSGETRIDVAQDVKNSLERAKGRIIGVVLNKMRMNTGNYRYRYYYYYDYNYEREETETEDES